MSVLLWDRAVVINLDRRPDRLADFRRSVVGLQSLSNWQRFRAVDGEAVVPPGFFTSGAGAYACRQSHLRVLEDALMDGVNDLLVLEDDCRFVSDFDARLMSFFERVPIDAAGFMIGGQHHKDPVPVADGVVRVVNCQRTHAYAVRGKLAMRNLYKLWARADRHIDHLLPRWQAQFPVYAPDPFLCGQDAGPSDVSGNEDRVRFWSKPPADTPIWVLQVPKSVADELRQLGATWGDDLDPRTGESKQLGKLCASFWPAGACKKWADDLVASCHGTASLPCVWPSALGVNWGRPTRVVVASTTEAAVEQIPALLPVWRARRVVWLLRGEPPGRPWATGRPPVRAKLGQMVATGDYGRLGDVVRQLRTQGRPLVAHPDLDARLAAASLNEPTIELADDPADWEDQVAAAGRV